MAGEEAAVKEKMIAVEVFGRDPRIDVPDDTIVRVSAREVRKRLAQYYVTPEGATAPIRIELHAGAYAPEFRYRLGTPESERTPATAMAEPVVAESRGQPPMRETRFAIRWQWIAAAAASIVVVAGIRWTTSQASGPFELFWAPVFQSSEPVLLTIANPIVYHASGRAQKLDEETRPPQDSPSQRALALRPDQLDGSDLVPVFNQYVGVGDMVAVTEAAAMLGRRNKTARVRLSSGVEFADLRGAHTVLIGAVTNRWTMEMQKNWRFQFRRKAGVRNIITDTQDAGQREWMLPIQQDGSAQEDYILLCRIPNSFTDGLMVVTAGMRQFGTEAGGRVIADRSQLNRVLSKLPTGWETKNLQVVLHVSVIGNAPAQPEVVAWHLW